MSPRTFGMLAGLLVVGLIGGLAAPQPPGAGDPKKEKKGKGFGPPPFQLGRVLPPPLREQLLLTKKQQQEIDALEKDVRERLDKILTPEQKKLAESFRPGPLGKPEPPAKLDRPESTGSPGPRVIVGGQLRVAAANTRQAFTLMGDAAEGELGDLRKENSGRGIRLLSGVSPDKDSKRSGAVSWTVAGIKPDQGRWFRFRIRGLAQAGFRVQKDDLFLRVDFFKDGGTNPLDHIQKSIYEQVETDRKLLVDPSMNPKLVTASWRHYAMEFRTPFAEVDTLRLTVGFGQGIGKETEGEFWIGEVEIIPIPDPTHYIPPPKLAGKPPPVLASLVKIGGRWYYDPRGGSKELPPQFDHTNADRLYYFAGRLETPFAGNTTAWLRKGYLDQAGQLVDQDRFVADNVVVSFTDEHLVIKSHSLPNHPTAVFPDRWRVTDGNPNYIREQVNTWHVPLEPREDPKHIAMDEKNTNLVLPLGPIGVAVNGIVFLYPFDESTEVDALWRLDRCCGHPSPGQRDHYHKYPVCLNTPWADDGKTHSPLLGFAFDGYPIYGPYEAAGELAKDSKKNPLNAFNLHKDDERGWHYHVTPGQFPHIIGGFWGAVENKNFAEKKGPFPKKGKK